MDPEARFVLTARDATAHAFASADRNLKSFTRGAMQLRTVLAGFGVVLSGRALANWMKHAIETTDAVGEQRVAVERAQAAFESFRDASDSLAETFAVRATPAVLAFADALDQIRKFTAPTAQDILTGRIEDAKREMEALERAIQAPFRDLYQSEEAKRAQDQRLLQLKETIRVLEAAQLASDQAQFTRLPEITEAETKALEDFITTLNLPKNIASQDEWVKLETFIYDLNQALSERPPMITDEERIALEEFIYELNQVPERLTQEEWIDLESFIYDLNNMEEEANAAAQFIGQTFRDAFTDWILGTERDFGELLRRMATQMAVSGIFDAFANAFSGGTSGFAKFMSSFFGGARASGGPVSAGRSYLVGERGPEIFTPSTSGMISAGGMAIYMGDTNIDARGADSSLIQRLPKILDAHRQQTKAEIADLIRRNRFATA